MTDREVDEILERFDQTDVALQRKIVARIVADREVLRVALEELLVPQGRSISNWLNYLVRIGRIPSDHGVVL